MRCLLGVVLANHFYFVARRSIADMTLIVLGGGALSERRSRAGLNSINHIAVDEAYGEFTNAKETIIKIIRRNKMSKRAKMASIALATLLVISGCTSMARQTTGQYIDD